MASGSCRRGRHVLRTDRLRFQTPSFRDLKTMEAAASDPEAQRWLGWPPGGLVLDPYRERLLARPVGRGRPYRGAEMVFLIAVDLASGRLAGAVGVTPGETYEVGGWLAPGFRGHGLGGELFGAVASFAHRHLGVTGVVAGTETVNVASARALLSAGFVPAPGPDTHRLPDGRVIPSRWLRHDDEQPATCGVA